VRRDPTVDVQFVDADMYTQTQLLVDMCIAALYTNSASANTLLVLAGHTLA